MADSPVQAKRSSGYLNINNVPLKGVRAILLVEKNYGLKEAAEAFEKKVDDIFVCEEAILLGRKLIEKDYALEKFPEILPLLRFALFA